MRTRAVLVAMIIVAAPSLPAQSIRGRVFDRETAAPIAGAEVAVPKLARATHTNERGEFLMSTLPVIDTTTVPATGTVVVPHFADGGGWITQVLLVNPTEEPMSGSLLFLSEYSGSGSMRPLTAPTNLCLYSWRHGMHRLISLPRSMLVMTNDP